jgi:hypothetical protein
MRQTILALLALLLALLLAAPAIGAGLSTSGKCRGSRSCDLGEGSTTSFTFTTDGTGDAEINLPAGAIGTTEILDNTIAAGDIAADTIDFTEITDTMALDADTSVTAGDGETLSLITSHTSGDVSALLFNFNQVDDGAATDDSRVIQMDITSESGDTADTLIVIDIEYEEGTANTILDAAIAIDNEETTASTMTDAILITSSGVDAGVTDGLDVSASNITNGVNVGANLILGSNDENILIGSADSTFSFVTDGTETATLTGADAAGASNTIYDTSGAGTVALGSADVTAATVVTDGGTVTLDGTITARFPVVSLASGALTLNTIHLATAGAADYDIPDLACDAAGDIGNWVTVVLEDASVVISITSDDASNVIFFPGLDLGAGDELDSVSTASSESFHITLVCLAAEGWYTTSTSEVSGGAIAWADGGAAD